MAPPDAKAVKAIIRAHRPKFRSKAAKLAFAVHAFFLAEGYKPVAVGKGADEAPADKKMTQEADTEGWDELSDVFAFRYLPESGRPEDGLQVRMQAMGDTLLLHWQPIASSDAPKTLELRVPAYVAETPSLDDVDGYKNLQELLSKLDAALHAAPQTKGPAAVLAGGGSATATFGGPQGNLAEPLERPSRPAPGEAHPSGDGDDLHADGRRPPANPEPGLDDPDPDDPEGMVPPPLGWPAGGMVGAPPDAIGAADLVPPGLRAPGTAGGFGVPHIQPGPGLGLPGMLGGMHVGPGDPLYAGRMRVPPGGSRGGGGALPGARYDPIGPRGMPGWDPDDFRRGGPGNPGGPPHPDIQPPGPRSGPDFDSMFG